ncbi:MAG TPA: SOS response-associated peptidase [Candidatus Didemnitutus sp.]|jgi:putative SOS response-associated peptidase YedK
MCTRYTLTQMQVLAEFCQTLGAALEPERFAARYNVAPTQEVPVIVDDGSRHVVSMSFGFSLKPRPTEKRGLLMVTARSESILEKPTFRDAAAHRRCLVPADGFFEWEKNGAARLPHFLQLKGRRPFCFAGLWQPKESWRPAGFVIVTTQPNELLESFHDRMPVILGPHTAPLWIGHDALAPEAVARLCRPLPAALMERCRVDPRMNNVRHEAPDTITPLPA